MKIKALLYLIRNDKKLFFNFFFKNPFIYSFRYLKSLVFYKRKTEKGAYLFGVATLSEFKNLLKDEKIPLILGFSYCQKPKNCKAPRFSSHCLGSKCSKCLISKYISRRNVYSISIPTVNYLGQQIYEIIKKKPSQVIFIITACDFAISMFENLSMILNLKGLALPLEGDVCTSFSSFVSSEKKEKLLQTRLPLKQAILLDELLENRNK